MKTNVCINFYSESWLDLETPVSMTFGSSVGFTVKMCIHNRIFKVYLRSNILPLILGLAISAKG